MSRVPAPRGRKKVPKKGDLRQEAILETLERLLADRSIAEVGVEDIASGAGVSRSAFYFYFESKHAALAAAVGQLRERIFEAAAGFFRRTDEAPEAAVRRSLAGVAEIWSAHRHLLGAVVESAVVDPGVRTLWHEWVDAFVGAITTRIEEERAAGTASEGPPSARSLATVLAWSNERNLYVAHLGTPSKAETDALVDALTTVWVSAIYGHDRAARGG